jgi:hypothetical protein
MDSMSSHEGDETKRNGSMDGEKKRKKKRKKERRKEKKKKKKHKKRLREEESEDCHEELLQRLLEAIIAADDAFIVRRRLSRLMKAQPKSWDLEEAFHVAVRSGDIAAEIALHSCGVDVDSLRPGDPLRMTALHAACLLGDGAMAALLVRQGAKYDGDAPPRDAAGDTANDLGLAELISVHENEMARAEAEARATEREIRQMAELSAERAKREADWAARIQEASCEDRRDFGGETSDSFGGGWDAVAEDQAHAKAPAGDWWERIAQERLKARRRESEREAAARKDAEGTGAGVRRRQYGPAAVAAGGGGGRGGGGRGRRGGEKHEDGNNHNGSRTDTAGSRDACQPPQPHQPPPPSLLSNMTESTDEEAEAVDCRKADNDAWVAFATLHSPSSSQSTLTPIAMSDIPWPSAGDQRPLPGGNSLSLGDRKVMLRLLQRRWHPDKFTQRFGARIEVVEKRSILQRVTEISQEINAVAMALLE